MCENALVTGFALHERPIERSTIQEVCGDLDLVTAGAGPAAERPTAVNLPEAPPLPPIVHHLADDSSGARLFTMFPPPRRRFFSWS
jgi:hypothetical protein